MWIVFSILCMIMLTITEIVGKKAVSTDDLAPLKLRIMVMAISGVLGLAFYVFGLGESGLAPWILFVKHPVVLAAVVCTVLTDFFYIFSLKYIGMAIMEAISSLEGIFIFTGITLVNLASGGLSAISDMFMPERLVLIIIIMIFTILLPNIELLTKEKAIKNDRQNNNHIAVGVLIALLAAILSSGDSLITDTLLDSGEFGVVDMTMTAYFSQLLLLPVFCFTLYKKSKQSRISVKIVNRYSVVYTIFYVGAIFIGLLAASIDAVRSEVLYLTYPVISILGAKIILKEKYTWRQNLCIWVITIAAMLFCVIDYFV